MSMKNCCPFIVYMPNKPDKFWIKFWLLVEVESKYVVNLQPYLGAQEKESRQGVPLAQDVVLQLVSPVKSKGYNITTDNFFTSVALFYMYNKNKVGVGCSRPNGQKVFNPLCLKAVASCNILNIAALNAWILYQKATGKTISRKILYLLKN